MPNKEESGEMQQNNFFSNNNRQNCDIMLGIALCIYIISQTKFLINKTEKTEDVGYYLS